MNINRANVTCDVLHRPKVQRQQDGGEHETGDETRREPAAEEVHHNRCGPKRQVEEHYIAMPGQISSSLLSDECHIKSTPNSYNVLRAIVDALWKTYLNF